MNIFYVSLLVMLFSLSAFRTNFFKKIPEDNKIQFTATSKNVVFVFNQPKYAAGDTVYFSCYLFSPNQSLIKGKLVMQLNLITAQGEQVLKNRIKLVDGVGEGQWILPENLSAGNYLLIAQNESEKQNQESHYVADLSIASDSLTPIQPFPVSPNTTRSKIVDILTTKKEYGRREEVNVKIKLNDLSGNPRAFKASIAVYKEELFKNESSGNMSAVMFTRNADSVNVKKNMTGFNATSLSSAYFFRGRVFQGNSDEPVRAISKITFYLNGNDFVYAVNTTPDGWFEFPLFKDFEDEEIFYSVFNKNKLIEDAVIRLEDQSFEVNYRTKLPTKTADGYGVYANQKRGILNSYGYYQAKKSAATISKEVDFPDCDLDVELGKYETFASMEDVIINVVPMLKIWTSKQGKEVRVFLAANASLGRKSPIFIVNGVMTDSTNYVLSLDPKQINRIGVIRTEQKLARFGDLGANGIVVIETSMANIDIQRCRKSLTVAGITKPHPYYSPTYSQNIQSRIPDLRAGLYWNPQLNTTQLNETSVKFFTSDDTGYFVIEIFGITDRGETFVERSRIKVSANQN